MISNDDVSLKVRLSLVEDGWREHHRMDEVFGIGRNPVLERRINPLMNEAEKAIDETGPKQRLFGEIDYAAQTWDRERRVIMKAERLLDGPNRRLVVTSLDAPPQSVYDVGYTPRGDMENCIKEQQLMLFALEPVRQSPPPRRGKGGRPPSPNGISNTTQLKWTDEIPGQD